MTRLVVLLAALLAAAAAVQGSQATFTASKTNSGSSFATASNFPPAVTLTAPGRRLGHQRHDADPERRGRQRDRRQSTTVTVKIYSGSTATGTPVQTQHRHPLGRHVERPPPRRSPRAPTPPGHADRHAGNTGTSTANTFTVDTTQAHRDVGRRPPTRPAARRARSRTATSSPSPTPSRSRGLGVERLERREHGREREVHQLRHHRHVTVLTATTGTVKLGSVATNGNYVSATTTFASTMVLLGRRRLDHRHARHARQRAGAPPSRPRT